MPDIKISQLDPAASASGAMEIEVNDGGNSRKVTLNQVDDLVLGAAQGIIVRDAANSRVARAITAGGGIAVSNGNGVSGNPTVAINPATQAQAEAGTDNTRPMTPLRTAQAIAAMAGGVVKQVFTSSGTFTKQADDIAYYVEVWGGGGSGGRNYYGAGGGGGAYMNRWLFASDIGATIAITVGAGGAARTSNGNGSAGGTTSFGDAVSAFGGVGGGAAASGSTAPGGGGGGIKSAGTGGTGGAPGGGAATGTGRGSVFGGGGASGESVFGGGGGGGAGGATGAPGGGSVFGGGGGGGAASSSSTGSGGVSTYGGSGGAGGDAASGVDGQIPSGGGGGTRTGATTGAGARGEVRVWRFKK